MANKVEFGISNLHIGTYTVGENNAVTLGTPYHQKGAISFSPEQESNENTAYADNIAYWSEYTDGPFTGDLVTMLYDDEFLTQFMGYRRLSNGGLAHVKNAVKPNVYIAFDIEGDAEKRRAIFYNCSLGAINRSYETIEDEKEPANETLPISCVGDNATGVTKATFRPNDAGYNTLYTAPTAPAFAE